MSMIRREFLPSVDHFTTIPNAWLRDPNMTRRARGLLVELLSHREGWSVTVESLARAGREGKAAISRDLRELEELGYLRREQSRTDSGFGSMDYILTDPADAEKSQVGNGTRLPGTDNTVTGESDTDYVDTDYVDTTNVNTTNVSPTNPPTKKNNPKNTNQGDQGRGGSGSARPAPAPRGDVPPTSDLEPMGRCAAHADGDPGTPCRACGAARRERVAWLADAPRRRAEAEREATRQFLHEQRSKQASERASEHVARIKEDLARRSKLPRPTASGTF